MKSFTTGLLLFIFQIILVTSVSSQTNFDLGSYKNFLSNNQNLSASQLMNMYSSGIFQANAKYNLSSVSYFDSVCNKLSLTADEKDLIAKNGFMVSERLSSPTFSEALAKIWYKDLPLFITTDAILHSIHKSYDAILKDIELEVLIPDLQKLLTNMHTQLGTLNSKYSSNENIKQMLKDVDIYITVPLQLLGENVSSYYPENSEMISKLMNYISSEQAVEDTFFASTQRRIDFSQFTVRAHYTDNEYPQLAKYFKAMMWLGRIEIYLLPPRAYKPKPTMKDIQRQTIDAALISELLDLSGSASILAEMDNLIKMMIGESDNVTIDNLNGVLNSVNFSDVTDLLDTLKLKEFQDTLKTKSFAYQRILSQMIMQDFKEVDSLIPASSFLLLGQRFIIDSYVSGNVVYDKILWNGTRIRRMLPSSLDILFALGNNAAAQLLKPELEYYYYSQNLAALHYLIDNYDNDFWDGSLYNLWLNSIRKLNPPENRSSLPAFMQTAGWWQEKMNTQLASWTELRHDNLLYAKQSYTGMVPICSYPYCYVEPIPEFFEAVHQYAILANSKLMNIKFTLDGKKEDINNYFKTLDSIAIKLKIIAEKELANLELTKDETEFLQKMYSSDINSGCVPKQVSFGWYTDLFYRKDIDDKNYVVADIHTSPTDTEGNLVGWVKHIGTGPINLGVFIVETPDKKTTAYTGPVMSYYEHTTTNFKRLTDEEWETSYNISPSFRPSFVNIYLADTEGNSKGSGTNLLTSIVKEDDIPLPKTTLLVQNYPNPFNPSTNIRFIIPADLANAKVKLVVYNLQGEKIATLVNNELPAGNYITKWNGTDDRGIAASSGVYFYQLIAGPYQTTGKMILMK